MRSGIPSRSGSETSSATPPQSANEISSTSSSLSASETSSATLSLSVSDISPVPPSQSASNTRLITPPLISSYATSLGLSPSTTDTNSATLSMSLSDVIPVTLSFSASDTPSVSVSTNQGASKSTAISEIVATTNPALSPSGIETASFSISSNVNPSLSSSLSGTGALLSSLLLSSNISYSETPFPSGSGVSRGSSVGSITSSQKITHSSSLSLSRSERSSPSLMLSEVSTVPRASKSPLLSEIFPSVSSSATPQDSINPSMMITTIYPSNLTSIGMVELSDSSADYRAGILFVPLNLSNQANTTLITTYRGNITNRNNQQALVSAILNITLLDGQRNSITRLDSPLTICLALTEEQKGKIVCLSYYDERKAKWICEDECLTTFTAQSTNATKGRDKGETLLCGQTDHLTNFALLLIGNEEEDPCRSGKGNTLAWISLGMVGGAILLVAISVLVIEIQMRWNSHQISRQLRDIGTQCTTPDRRL